MPDYLRTARALRRKAADPVVPEPERRALLEKAAALERKYAPPPPPPPPPRPESTFNPFYRNHDSAVYDTTITDRSGHTNVDPATARYWAEYLARLRDNQWQWNRPPTYPDEADLVEEGYQYDGQGPSDYGYDEDEYLPEDEY